MPSPGYGYALAAGILNATSDIMFAMPRGIAGILPACVVEERHLDRLTVTTHPVERGAAITDHSYKLPTELTLRWAWTNSGYGEGFVQQVYQSLLDLQSSREPFILSTGKKQYSDMLMTSLLVTTDANSETALFVTATCQGVIFVNTQAATAPALPARSQQFPQQTTAVTNTGNQQAKPVTVPNSILKDIVDGSGLKGKVPGL